MKSKHILTTVALSLMGACLAWSADSKSSLNAADEKFVKQEAMNGKAVVQIAELGVKKAASDNVKAIAEQMVKDHTMANAELTELAKSKGVELSSAGSPDADKAVADLEKVSGKEFDKAFLKQLKSDHKDCVSAFEDAAKDSTDGELKAWTAKTLPALKAHLSHITKTLDAE